MSKSTDTSQATAQEVGESAQTPEVVDSGDQLQNQYGNAFMQEMLLGGEADGAAQEAPSRGGPRPGAPGTKAEALRRNKDGVKIMRRIVSSGLSITPDPSKGMESRANQFHNAAEWVDQGEADLVVVTPTHDSEKRPSVPPDKIAWFDKRCDFKSDSADYDDSLDAAGNATNDDAIIKKFPGTLGGLSLDGQTLTIHDPVAHSESTLVETLIHEVQHDADQHDRGDPWTVARPAPAAAAARRAPAWAINLYLSELRAYWTENPEGSASDAFGSSSDTGVTDFQIDVAKPKADGTYSGSAADLHSATTAFSNKRQEDIFNHLFAYQSDNRYLVDGDWTSSYAYLPFYYVLDPAFKQIVDSYTAPEGGNLVNSVRIQNLSDCVGAGNGTGAVEAANALDEIDRQHLADRVVSASFWKQLADSSLSPEEKANVEAIASAQIAGPHQRASALVQPGDTLSRIADRYLGSSSRWPEIHAMNRNEIGDDAGNIRPGQRLLLPDL